MYVLVKMDCFRPSSTEVLVVKEENEPSAFDMGSEWLVFAINDESLAVSTRAMGTLIPEVA